LFKNTFLHIWETHQVTKIILLTLAVVKPFTTTTIQVSFIKNSNHLKNECWFYLIFADSNFVPNNQRNGNFQRNHHNAGNFQQQPQQVHSNPNNANNQYWKHPANGNVDEANAPYNNQRRYQNNNYNNRGNNRGANSIPVQANANLPVQQNGVESTTPTANPTTFMDR